LKREPRRSLWAAASALAVLLAWGAYQSWAAPNQPGYLQELVLVDPYNLDSGTIGFAGLVARGAENIWIYLSRIVPQTVLGVEDGPAVLMLALGLAFAGLALAGWVERARRSLGAFEIFALLYVGLIAIWPEAWTDRRLLLPLLPVLLLLSVEYVDRRGGRARWGQACIGLLVAVPSLTWVIQKAPERIECVAAYRAGSPCEAPAFASLYAAARWVRDNTPQDAIVANRKPRLFYWYSGRRGTVYPYSARPDVVIRGLDRMAASFVVVDLVSSTTPRYLIPAIQATEPRFETVYQGGSPPTTVLRIRSLETERQVRVTVWVGA
ncbi:MAG: hypothetical protein MJB57_03295, partial [Gemmatimonadetes bacterium]|nr:hypothetical protein [Gemmatimonadota bacterium]